MAKQAIEIQDGDSINYVAAGAIAIGDVVVFEASIGIANDDAVLGDTISVSLTKAWEMTAATADVIVVGNILYWDAGNSVLTTVSTANTLAGRAISAKEAAVAGTVVVRLG